MVFPQPQNRAPSKPRTVAGICEILKIIAAAPISDGAKRTASDIFRALGEAEAKVHNVHVEKVHFHEVGAADAIVDIVCAAVGADALRSSTFVCSPLNVGGGTVKCAHGVMPVPGPGDFGVAERHPCVLRRGTKGACDADWCGHRTRFWRRVSVRGQR